MFLFKKKKQNNDDEIVIGKQKKQSKNINHKKTDPRLDKLRDNPDEIIVYNDESLDQLVELSETNTIKEEPQLDIEEEIIVSKEEDLEENTDLIKEDTEIIEEFIKFEADEVSNDDNIEETIIKEEFTVEEQKAEMLVEEHVEDLIKDEFINEEPTLITEQVLEEEQEEIKDLNTYFGSNNEELKKGKKKKSKKEKVSKRKKRRKKDLEDITERRVYKFKDKKFSKVEDLIEYLNDHYLDIEELSKEMLDSEEFYGFIRKKSGVFDASLEEYKKIKKEIEK
ncbi:hypothetical protein CI105_01715 [Candidatus Izimaplasma bacterium ZiA1]|uniref:hypothetical protein n=1 Tax=Candidatus Izimoplasma sp. ZiA1 TaxID=2024899 RepID=UPI000BAA64D8|nr:hypothetical protein CI105_01715 [Candidatus Izimaplasma bacterium ZiA1]